MLLLLRSIQTYLSGGIFLLVYISEILYPQRKELIDYQHDIRNIGIGLVNLVIVFMAGYYFQQWIIFFNQQHFGLLQLMKVPFVIELLIGFIVIDCFMYWWHRLNHIVPFFWAFHRFHHKDEKLNSTSAVRFHLGELLLSFAARSMVFPLLGLEPTAIVLYGFILFPVIIFHHSNIKISGRWDMRIRRLIVSPIMHRIHHSKLIKETHSNYSSILPYWDKLFGTYTPKPTDTLVFGL